MDFDQLIWWKMKCFIEFLGSHGPVDSIFLDIFNLLFQVRKFFNKFLCIGQGHIFIFKTRGDSFSGKGILSLFQKKNAPNIVRNKQLRRLSFANIMWKKMLLYFTGLGVNKKVPKFASLDVSSDEIRFVHDPVWEEMPSWWQSISLSL